MEWNLGVGSPLVPEDCHDGNLQIRNGPEAHDVHVQRPFGFGPAFGLELDLGPSRVLREENRRAYSMSSLRVLATRLRSDGVLVVRVTEEDKAYRRALDEIFSEVGVHTIDTKDLLGNSVKGVFYIARM